MLLSVLIMAYNIVLECRYLLTRTEKLPGQTAARDSVVCELIASTMYRFKIVLFEI